MSDNACRAEHFGCDGRFYPVAQHHDARTGELVQSRPIVDDDDWTSAELEPPDGQIVYLAMAKCTDCRPAENPEVVVPPAEDESTTDLPRPWWNHEKD